MAHPSAALRAWTELGLQPWVAHQCIRLGMPSPTPVQRDCIGPILSGCDVVASAPTGSGKTAAYALPLLQMLGSDPYGVFAVVLAPTRELANQVRRHIETFGAPIGVRVLALIGGTERSAQAAGALRRPHVIVGTPGRVADHFDNTAGIHLSRLKVLILDEADRMLGVAHEEPMKRIMARLPPSRSAAREGQHARTTLLFSATVSPALRALGRAPHVHSYAEAEGGGSEMALVRGLSQRYVFLPAGHKETYLMYLLRELDADRLRVIVFVPTRRVADVLTRALRTLMPSKPNAPRPLRVLALHAHLPQTEREHQLTQFSQARRAVLVATDLASRGLDIPAVDVVINLDVPAVVEDYVHRVGRTARAGANGLAITFVTDRDIDRIKAIETAVGSELTEHPIDDDEAIGYLDEVSAALRIALIQHDMEEERRNDIEISKSRQRHVFQEDANKRKRRK